MEALELLLRDTNATDLTVFARTIDTPANYRLTREIVPTKSVQGVRFRTTSAKRRVNAAKFRAYETPTALAKRQAERVVNEGMLPALGQTLPVSEMDQILLDVGHGQDTAGYIDLLYSDVERHVESIQTAQELAAGKLLGADGIVPLPGLGLDVNWNVPVQNRPTAAVLWDQESATPLSDERAWIDYLVGIGAPLPKMVLTSRRARALLAANAEYRTAYYGSNAANTPSATLAPNEVDVVRARYSLPPIVEYDVQVWDDDQYVRVIPDNKWILVPDVPASEWAETQYGVTRESMQFTSGTNPVLTREEAPGIVVVTHVDDNPVQIYTRGAAIGMPVLYVPDIFISATVL